MNVFKGGNMKYQVIVKQPYRYDNVEANSPNEAIEKVLRIDGWDEMDIEVKVKKQPKE